MFFSRLFGGGKEGPRFLHRLPELGESTSAVLNATHAPTRCEKH